MTRIIKTKKSVIKINMYLFNNKKYHWFLYDRENLQEIVEHFIKIWFVLLFIINSIKLLYFMYYYCYFMKPKTYWLYVICTWCIFFCVFYSVYRNIHKNSSFIRYEYILIFQYYIQIKNTTFNNSSINLKYFWLRPE